MKDLPQDLITPTLLDGVLTLTLGNGKAHALSQAMIAALYDALQGATRDPDVRVIVLHGPGSIFCAGHDLKEIKRHRQDADNGKAYLTHLFQSCAQMMLTLATCPKPTLARVEGIATAAGLQLVASCDMAFASDTARVCLPGVRNGGFCTTPAVAVSRAVGHSHLMELMLSGEDRGADWALRAGLLNEILPADALPDRVEDFARTLAGRNLAAIAAGKSAILAQRTLDLEQAYALATPVMVGHFLDPARLAHEKDALFKPE